MNAGMMIWVLMAVPVLLSLTCLALKSPRQILLTVSFGGAGWAILTGAASWPVFNGSVLSTGFGWFRLDSLSAYHAAVLSLIFGASSVYSFGYFSEEIAENKLTLHSARKFGTLWFGSAGAMIFVLLCNNLGLMWVGVESITLLTAFLICVHVSPLSLEAMWKYLVVCSVGVSFAFVGTLLVGASAQKLGFDSSQMLMWTSLHGAAGGLAPGTMKLAFIFLLVGYGTKSGLAPLHSWLPDAHSQAPAPVSALFSGFMLNTALYCIMRYIPLIEGATGNSGWGLEILIIFGIVSILISAAFIVFQTDGKRLFAYSSVEHMGIIVLGLGLGGAGVFAALWHTLNHAICKSLVFFSIGRLGQMYGSHDLNRMAGAMRRVPLWGIGLFGGVLALIGVAPFAVFMSELQIMKAAVDARAFTALIIFLLGAGIVFVGTLRQAMIPAWGTEVNAPLRVQRSRIADYVLVIGALGLLLMLGLWMPGLLRTVLEQAAAVIGGRP